MKIEKNKSLKELTTWRVGGNADFFINAKNDGEIKDAVKFAKKDQLPLVIIGNGSNILVNDKGFRGLVIKISNKKVDKQKDKLICGAGLQLPQLLDFAKRNKMFGAEFLYGIPGTVGGAIVGNASTNNQSVSDILTKIKVIDTKGVTKILKPSDVKFAYRNSDFKKNDLIIVEATLKFSKTKPDTLINLAQNRANQPKGFSAGSVFKNPKQEIGAGALIENALLKGKIIGGAQISKLHGNFIMNLKSAKAADIIKLISLIQEKVKNKFGVQLKREVRILGEKGWQ